MLSVWVRGTGIGIGTGRMYGYGIYGIRKMFRPYSYSASFSYIRFGLRVSFVGFCAMNMTFTYLFMAGCDGRFGKE
jgi:hypothetical protein